MSRNCQDMIEDSVEWAENFMKSSVWRYPKSEQNRIPKFFPIPKFFDTESDTKFFRYWIRFFFIPIFFVPISILFLLKPKIFDTYSETIKNMKKFRNRNVTQNTPNLNKTESTNFSDTKFIQCRIRYFSDTKFFRYWIRYFFIPNQQPSKKWKT